MSDSGPSSTLAILLQGGLERDGLRRLLVPGAILDFRLLGGLTVSRGLSVRVFISSPSEDLKYYRNRVVEQVVRDTQWMPLGIEHFTSDPRPIVERCRDQVRKCDLMMLLPPWRRDWAPSAAKEETA